jgi:hypothetical protein
MMISEATNLTEASLDGHWKVLCLTFGVARLASSHDWLYLRGNLDPGAQNYFVQYDRARD